MTLLPNDGLFDTGMRYAPGIEDYKRREEIPAEERCEPCDGMGTQRIRFSGCFGGNETPDWKVCHSCHGTGRRNG